MTNLTQTMDAQAWADEWLKTIAAHPDIPTDRGTMIGWFANCSMAGYDEAMRRSGVRALKLREALWGVVGKDNSIEDLEKMRVVVEALKDTDEDALISFNAINALLEDAGGR